MAFWFSLCDTNYFTFNLMWRFLIRYCLSGTEQRVESDSSDFPKQTKSQTSTSCEDAGSQNIDKGLKKQKDALRSCFWQKVWLNSQEESYWEPIEFERLRIGDRRHTEQVSRLTPIHWWCQSQWTVISGVMQSAQIEGLITKQIRPPMAAPLKGPLKILIGLPGRCHLGLLQFAETDFLRIEGWATTLPNFSPAIKFMSQKYTGYHQRRNHNQFFRMESPNRSWLWGPESPESCLYFTGRDVLQTN